MKSVEQIPEETCRKYRADCLLPNSEAKVGITLNTLHQEPLNTLRHPVQADTCGWYIWGGEDLSKASNFFQPLYVKHLTEECPQIVPCLGLVAPGWRILLAGDYVDVWYDEALLGVEPLEG